MCLGIPAEIISINPAAESQPLRTGTVRYGQLTKTVNLACVPEAVVGDHVLVHAGIAIGRLLPEQVTPLTEALESLQEPEATV